MRVRAKHWLKHGGTWYRGGEEFEIATTEADELAGMVEIAETPVFIEEPEEPITEQPKRRGRRSKQTD